MQELVEQIGGVTGYVTRQKYNDFAEELVTHLSQARNRYIYKYIVITAVMTLAPVTIIKILSHDTSDKIEPKILVLVTAVSQG